MKKILYITCATLFILLTAGAAGCSRGSGSGHPYKWPAINREIDSLTNQLEKDFYDYRESGSLDSTIRRLEEASRQSTDRVARARALYWRGRWMKRYSDADSALSLAKHAISLLDSAENRYDFYRTRALVRQYSHSIGAESYRDIDEEARYYNSIGDRAMTATMYISLATTLFSIGDYDKSLQLMLEADKINSELGFSKLVYKNKINIANIYQRKGEKSKTIDILRKLTRTPEIQNDSAASNLILRNLYVYTGDIRYLRQAYAQVEGRENHRDLQGLYQSLFSDYYNEAGNADSAAYFSRAAAGNINYVSDFDHKSRIMQSYARTLEREGKIDSALRYQKLTQEYTDSDYMQMQQSEVLRISNLREVSEIMSQEREATQNTRFRFIGAIFILILIAVGVYVVLYRRQKRHEMAAQQSKLEMEKERRSLLAMMLVLEEKDNLFSFLKTEIEKMRKDNSIGVPEARHLESTIQTHLSGDEDWKTFQQQFVQIYPIFTKKLLAEYPGLSETYVKLATYIFMGLDNNRIARLLAIRPESVKQARWRLRKMMNLEKEQSLDDTIRSLDA